MRVVVLSAILLAALPMVVQAQQVQRRVPSQQPPAGQNWLDYGDEGDDNDDDDDYIRDSEVGGQLDGGMAGSDDMYGDDVLPGNAGPR